MSNLGLTKRECWRPERVEKLSLGEGKPPYIGEILGRMNEQINEEINIVNCMQ